MEAFKLAEDKKLSVEVCSLTRDSKRDQLIIVVKVSEHIEGREPRITVDYHLFQDCKTEAINDILAQCKADSINAFLGISGEEVTPTVEAEPVAESKPAKKKTAAKKKTTKKPPVQKKADLKVAESPKEEDSDDLDTDFDLEDEGAKEEETPKLVMYDKTKVTHKDHLRPIVHKVFGEDWRTDKEAKDKVRSAIKELDGKVAVTDSDGKVLESFNETTERLLA